MSSPVQPAPFLSRSLALYYANGLATLVAANVFVYALVILREQYSNSHVLTGLLVFGVFGPSLLFGLWAGSLLDRTNRKMVLLVGQAVFGAISVLLAFLLWRDTLSTASATIVLPILSFAAGTAQSFVIPARLSLLGGLTTQDRIGNATLLLNVLVVGSFGAAPALAGWMRQTLPFSTIFLVTGLLFGVALFLLAFVEVSSGPTGAQSSAGRGIRDGLQFVVRRGVILELLVLTFFGLLMVGPIQTLVPNFARTELALGELHRGQLLGMLGLGLLVGGVFAAFLRNRPKGFWILAAILCVGMFSALLSAADGPGTAAAALLSIGLAGGLMAALLPAAIQSLTPDSVRGRVMGLYTVTFQGTPGVSGLLIASLAQGVGVRWALFFSALAVSTAAAGAVWLLSRARDLR